MPVALPPPAARPDADPDGLAGLRAATHGRYLVERELGRGGMGIVLLARDLQLERPVAIKLLPPRLAAQADLRDRFLREARAAAALSHPNIVAIHAVEEGPGATFFVMAYVDGETLTERVRRGGPLTSTDAARILQDVGWALAYTHERGIVHRDMKPDNVLLERATGRAFVTDFGIARVADSTLTVAGTSVGTPQFMSPEQAAGEPVDGRSDLYSLGVVAFFMLTGELPFDAPTMQAVMAMHLTTPPPPVSSRRAGLPPRLADAVDRCLRKQPEERFATAADFVAAVGAAQVGAGVEIAPPVRAFQRATESSVSQTALMLAILPSMASLAPEGARVLLLLTGNIALVVLLQFVHKARELLRDGFGYAEVRAAFEHDVRQREEETALAIAAMQRSGRAQRRRRLGLILLGVGGSIMALMLARKLLIPEVRLPPRLGGIIGGIMGALIGGGIAVFASANPRLERRMSHLGGPLILGGLGRWIFAVALRGMSDKAPPAPSAVPPSFDIERLWRALPAALRRATPDPRPVARALERHAESLASRARQLEASVVDAERDATGVSADDGTGVREALRSRRAALAAELREAGFAAVAARGESLAALETLRMALVRAGAGLGGAAELRREVEGARDALRPAGDPATP